MAYNMKYCFHVALLLVIFSSMVTAQQAKCLADAHVKTLHCFSTEGIDLEDPKYKLINKDQNGMIFDSLISEKPDVICDIRDQAKRALTCVMGELLKCVPTDFRSLIPEAALLNKALDKICENRADLDLKCVQSKSVELFNCGKEEGQKLAKEFQQEKGMKELMCLIYTVVPICQKKVLHDCGCITTKVYTNMVYDYLYPKSCPKINPHRVVCSQVDKDEFVDHGLGSKGGRPTVWFSTFFVVSCVFVSTFLFH